MTTTDTRIAELLGWKPLGHRTGETVWEVPHSPGRFHYGNDFTTDLNLTVREIERKGWDWFVGRNQTREVSVAEVEVGGVIYNRADEFPPAEALALAFLAALEAEKEGGVMDHVKQRIAERMTDRSWQVLKFAEMEAERLGHSYIGTEHLLLGLAREGYGAGGFVLRENGMDYQDVAKAIDGIIGGADRAKVASGGDQ